MKKRPFSKMIVGYVMILVTAFIIFCCYEMHRLGNLDPIQVMGAGIVALLASVVAAYMWRAKQQDVYDLQMQELKDKAELRQKYGDSYQDEPIDIIEE